MRLEDRIRQIAFNAMDPYIGDRDDQHPRLALINEIQLLFANHPYWNQQEAGTFWKPVSEAMPQTEYLVCNNKMLGWWAVASLDALGVWHYKDFRQTLKHRPTHIQELPSIMAVWSDHAA